MFPTITHLPPALSRSKRLFTVLLAILTAALAGCGSSAKLEQQDPELLTPDVNELKMTMLTDISSIIFSDSELNGEVKTDIARLAITPLRKSPKIQIAGTDQFSRPIAVTFQRAFEQSIINMLQKGNIQSATAIIHTDRPTTPLCNQSGKVNFDSLPQSIQQDPKRLKTIKDRTETMRLLARHKFIDLYVTYAHGGLKKRSQLEQIVFQSEVNNRKNIALHDVELSCSEIPKQLSGATYILKLRNGEKLFFSLTSSQAQDADNTMNREYWFDNLSNQKMQKRMHHVLNFLKDCGLVISI